MKINTTFAIITAAALALVACETLNTGTAQTAEAETVIADTSIEFDMETITCWDVLTAPEDATEYALTLLYGYAAGKSGAQLQSGEKIEAKISAAAETCAANPDMPAYQALN